MEVTIRINLENHIETEIAKAHLQLERLRALTKGESQQPEEATAAKTDPKGMSVAELHRLVHSGTFGTVASRVFAEMLVQIQTKGRADSSSLSEALGLPVASVRSGILNGRRTLIRKSLPFPFVDKWDVEAGHMVYWSDHPSFQAT